MDQPNDALALASAIALGIVVLGFIGALCWAIFQLMSGGDDVSIPEWKSELVRTLGIRTAPTPSREFSVEVEGIVVVVEALNGDSLIVSGTLPERDLTARLENGNVLGAGDGWTALSTDSRTELKAFVRDGGEVAGGRLRLKVEGTAAAAGAAERIALLTRALGGANAPPQSPVSILRRMSGAADPGRVSIVDAPAGSLSTAPESGALSLASKKDPPR